MVMERVRSDEGREFLELGNWRAQKGKRTKRKVGGGKGHVIEIKWLGILSRKKWATLQLQRLLS